MAEIEASVSVARVVLRRPDGTPVVGRSHIGRARALSEALFATDLGPPPEKRLVWIEENLEDFLGRSGTRARLLFALLLWICSYCAPLLIGRFRPLAALTLTDRIRALTRLEQRFGDPLVAVKAILCLIYYEHPDAARDVGFDGECARAAGSTR